MIYVIDDDEIMAECIARACRGETRRSADGGGVDGIDGAGGSEREVRVFGNAIEAMNEMVEVPDLIFLDILLDGPDGVTLLNELASYPDTAEVPVVVATSLDLTERDLAAYGVAEVLHKDAMRPEEIWAIAERYNRKHGAATEGGDA